MEDLFFLEQKIEEKFYCDIVNMMMNILSQEHIAYLTQLPEVLAAKEKIDAMVNTGSVYFSIDVTPEVKSAIQSNFDITVSDTIPMRWIKGDTQPHVDTSCEGEFDQTFLMYLTDSAGHLVLDGEKYPIAKGSAFVFSEGLPHETVGTGCEPRLLLGPMSEQGIPVGEVIPCLTEDTTVLTPSGYVNVTKLNSGDTVLTSDQREVKIVSIFKTIVHGNPQTYPCVVPKNSIGLNYPPEDMRISQDHMIRYREHWIQPRKCFTVDKTVETISYYHIELPNYITDHLVINGGVAVESFGITGDPVKQKKHFAEYNKRARSSPSNRERDLFGVRAVQTSFKIV